MIDYLKLAEKWSITDKPNKVLIITSLKGWGVLYLLGLLFIYTSQSLTLNL